MSDSVRLDKWLWAARFFKTRALAKKAIEGGKVHYDGARVKTSKNVELGALIRVPQGWDLRGGSDRAIRPASRRTGSA